jgi:carboxyl-terminal processing protease
MSRYADRRLLLLVLIGFFWFSLALVGGYLLGQADAAAGNDRLSHLAEQVAFRFGHSPTPSASSVQSGLSTEEQARFRAFWEAWGLVRRDFYDQSLVDSQKMTYGAIKGMLDSLGDPHTLFSTPRDRQLSEASLRGSFDGVGVEVDQREGKLRVIAPIEGSPADRAGLRAGDVITHVDDRDLKGVSLNDTVLMIRGPRGTNVTLTITRNGVAEPLSFKIQREEIRIEAVRSRMLVEGLGYVRIRTFSSSSAADTAAAVRRLNDQQPRGFVLDLRSNPGGFFEAAVDVTSQFLADGVVVYQQSGNGERQEFRAKPGGQATKIPVVVLIDRGSASASEIVAAALRDNGRAVLIGEKTYGKGTVQKLHTLSDSSGLRVTTAIWLTPGGHPLENQGLEPDVLVARPTAGLAGGEDPQLEAAVRQLAGSTVVTNQ